MAHNPHPATSPLPLPPHIDDRLIQELLNVTGYAAVPEASFLYEGPVEEVR